MTRAGTDSIARVVLDSDRVASAFKVGNAPYDVTFNAAGSLAYVTNLNDSTVGVINTSTQMQTTTFAVPGLAVRVRLGPGETKLYVTLDNGSVAVLNATSGAVVTTIALGPGPLDGLAFTSNRAWAYVGSVGGRVSEINTATDKVTRYFTPHATPQDVLVGTGDSTLYIADEAGSIIVWNLKTWTASGVIAVPAAFGLALTPDGKQLWVAEPGAGRITVVDCTSDTLVETIALQGGPRHIAITPDGTTAVVANEAGSVQIIR